jgi:hypothetical protein
VYLTTEKIYNTFALEPKKKDKLIKEIIIKDSKLDNMNIFEKWLYLIFKKDTY